MPTTEQPLALITGIAGQDGSYLAEQLLEKGFKVVGLEHPKVNTRNIDHLLASNQIRVLAFDFARPTNELEQILLDFRPGQIYHLAAQSSPILSAKKGRETLAVNYFGTVALLEAVLASGLDSKILVASSSSIFGSCPVESPQKETTPWGITDNLYAISKQMTHAVARKFREKFNLPVWVSIPFNHESPRRSLAFFPQKIAFAAAQISRGVWETPRVRNEFGEPLISNSKVRVGGLESAVDWGAAPDFARAMILMLAQENPGDFVLATGQTHTTGELARFAFSRLGLNYKYHLSPDARFGKAQEGLKKVGDATKARTQLGWEPKISFETMIDEMVAYQLRSAYA